MARPRDFKSPFPQTKLREALGEVELRTLGQQDRASGKPDRVPEVPRGFLIRMTRMGSDGTLSARFRRPDWIAKIAKANRPSAEALDALADRVSKQPTEANLRQAEVILGDLGRMSDGGKVLRSKVTQQLVDRIIGSGK
jgi:hypothetical protein